MTKKAGVEVAPESLAEVAAGQENPTNIQTEFDTETLKCILTDSELQNYGLLAARHDQEVDQAELELTAVKSQFKNRIDAATSKRKELSAKINQGYEFRTVDVQIVKDYTNNTVTTIRQDTGDQVRQRTMTRQECQRPLGFGEEAA
jgi:hypothetical protein